MIKLSTLLGIYYSLHLKFLWLSKFPKFDFRKFPDFRFGFPIFDLESLKIFIWYADSAMRKTPENIKKKNTIARFTERNK